MTFHDWETHGEPRPDDSYRQSQHIQQLEAQLTQCKIERTRLRQAVKNALALMPYSGAEYAQLRDILGRALRKK